MSFPKWDYLRRDVKNCPYTAFFRNPSNPQAYDPLPPIHFNRKEDSLDKIRFIVVSQEPGASLRKFTSDVNIMEEKLRENCKGLDRKGERLEKVTEHGSSPVNKMIQFFGTFDLETGPIYWTHALKCIPVRDILIKNQWDSCAPYCANHLKAEISAIPRYKIALVSIGGYAMTMCRNLLFGEDLKLKKITSYIRELKESQSIEYRLGNEEKSILFVSFLHPANRNRILARYDKDGRIENNESRQENILRDFLKLDDTLK